MAWSLIAHHCTNTINKYKYQYLQCKLLCSSSCKLYELLHNNERSKLTRDNCVLRPINFGLHLTYSYTLTTALVTSNRITKLAIYRSNFISPPEKFVSCWGVLPSAKRPEGRAARGRPGNVPTSGNEKF